MRAATLSNVNEAVEGLKVRPINKDSNTKNKINAGCHTDTIINSWCSVVQKDANMRLKKTTRNCKFG